PEELAELAVALGADVPGQLAPGAALGLGAGDEVAPLAPLAAHAFVIVGQRTPLATADVFREADRLGLPRSDQALEQEAERLQQALRPGARLPDELIVNDLEPAAISLLPQIDDALRAVRQAGAQQALVCGSGPTVAGLFWGPEAATQARRAASALADLDPPPLSATPVGPEFGAPQRLASSP
ncbi:MAG: 4-(cytidine 5'-diphospho)-2-C-methyl-D-erythritol kinase, partial [Actinomycetota bacterium]|nr:4-(cytidine 5'-diphospho)-2-C-methyl-D-erythritol kinase [Actinomycetota bacterium]